MIGLGVLAFGAVLGWWAVLIAGRFPLSWPALAGVTAAILAGGWIGPAIVRRLPGPVLRMIIGVAGLAIAVKLGIAAYR